MIKSMTGFGAASVKLGGLTIAVEARSVNQRFLDVKFNAPRAYLAAESDLKRVVGEHVARGRVEVFIARSRSVSGAKVVLNKALARDYAVAWKQLASDLGVKGELDLSLFVGRSDLFQAPDLVDEVDGELDEVAKILAKTMAKLAKSRAAEGRYLAADMRSRIKILIQTRKLIEARARAMGPIFSERMKRRVTRLMGNNSLDEARLAQEVAIVADRSDVTEELVRLDSHLVALRGLVSSSEPVGKRMDFILQEVSRELNTIGSKASDLEITNLIVDCKAEAEKLREQVQNIE